MAFLDTTWFGNTLTQYLYFLIYIAAGIIGGKIFYWISKNIIKSFTRKTKTRLDDLLIECLERPVIFLLFAIGFYLGSTHLTLTEAGQTTFTNIFSVLVTLNVGWFIMNIMDAFIVNYLQPVASKSKNDLDDVLLPILRKTSKVIIILLTIILIVDNFGYDVTSLIAGLGLGGLAFALAAQDLLKNLFGGVAILTDKPFKIGDRVRIDEKNDGWIREIGLRSTRMETLDGTMVVIPNNIIANTVLENVSKEHSRRIKVTLGLVYDTSMAKLEQAKKIITDVVKENKDTRDDSEVSLFNFGASSLDIQVIYWIKNKDNIAGARDKINMEIKKRFEKAKIEMAYPTQTVYIKK